ncbi:hypothetical protein EG329_011296 [Mollisiaceae sp. DMI_Dod_QoI]|nr:hypothetical protein EG329_011296 [Helotiales sp. DMI_Dod_QoI]
MSYQGWNFENMRRTGSEVLETRMLNKQAVEHPMPSFTPVNSTTAPVQFISPQRTLRATDLDLYEFPQERSDVLVSKAQKRGRTQGKNGRAVSIDPLWEYVDEGDLACQNNGDDFQTAFPKRRKSAPAKRTNSSKPPANTLSQFRSREEEQAAGLEMYENEQTGSQLATPPETSKTKRKRATSTKAQPSKPKMGPFKVPTITKPTVSRPKIIIEQPKPTTIYQGYVTTQETVKLAKTTLDKLAAFRYVPPSATQQAEIPPTNAQQSAQSEVNFGKNILAESNEEILENDPIRNELHQQVLADSAGYEEYFFRDEREDISSVLREHDPISEHNDFFTDATWNVQTSTQPQYGGHVEEVQCVAKKYTPESRLNKQSRSQLQLKSQDDLPIASDPSCSLAPQHEPYSNGYSYASAAQTKPAYGSSQYGEPDSSQTRAMLNLIDTPLIAQLDPIKPLRQSSSWPRPALDQSSTPQEVLNPDAPTLRKITGTQFLADKHKESSQVFPSLDQTRQHSRCLDPSRDVQVERSDIDEIDIATGDVSKDYAIDDFDEGLDDTDLLALVSQPVVPVTQYIRTPESPCIGNNPLSSSLKQSKAERAEKAEKAETLGNKSMLRTNEDQDRPLISSQPSSSHILNPEIDDEFPLDDEFEEEMMNLTGPDTGVIERFQPPASLQLTSRESYSSDELYDRSLQFSPPKPKADGVSPGGTGNPQTDKNKPTLSPFPISELSMVHEEDWSFIRANGETNVGGHTSESRPSKRQFASIQEVEDVEEVSPGRRQTRPILNPAIRGQPSTSQMTTAKTNTILDDSHEYEPLKPFARPDFPLLIRDRSPVVGLSPQPFLRVCFRVAEMLKEGARCKSLKQDAVIELFARVTHSSREPGTTEQHFQFADLWHDRPPFPNGILSNYKSSRLSPSLAESESRAFIGAEHAMMTRCFGRLKKDSQSTTGWLLDIITIRTTDWEEIKWTKRIC